MALGAKLGMAGERGAEAWGIGTGLGAAIGLAWGRGTALGEGVGAGDSLGAGAKKLGKLGIGIGAGFGCGVGCCDGLDSDFCGCGLEAAVCWLGALGAGLGATTGFFGSRFPCDSDAFSARLRAVMRFCVGGWLTINSISVMCDLGGGGKMKKKQRKPSATMIEK